MYMAIRVHARVVKFPQGRDGHGGFWQRCVLFFFLCFSFCGSGDVCFVLFLWQRQRSVRFVFFFVGLFGLSDFLAVTTCVLFACFPFLFLLLI